MTNPEAKPSGVRKVLTRDLRRKLDNRVRLYAEVQQEILERAGAMPIGVPLVTADPRIPPHAGKLCAAYVAAKTGKPRTIKAVTNQLEHFRRFAGDRPMTRELLEEWMVECNNMTASPASKHFRASIALSVAKWAAATKRMDVDITAGIRAPKAPMQQPRPLWTAEETDMLIDLANKRERTRKLILPIAMGWDTGMAISDCAELTWGEVDMEHCIIKRNRMKTGVLAVVPFEVGGRLHKLLQASYENAKARLGGNVAPTTPVILDFALRSNYLNMELSRFFKAAGIQGKTFHSWRSTLISQSIKAGVPTPVAMRMAGIKTAGVFSLYATIDDETIRENKAKFR